MNRLHLETSPYLLQHASNPVDWYPWGDEAFEKAKREDKPVFLSIGYSTCHWCHVMERESFENEDTAKVLNQFFVSVKVDREERPDVDTIYMNVCQLTTGGGGWPLSVFLDADRKPFFAGTYYPKAQFVQLLTGIARVWSNDRSQLTENSAKILDFLNKEKKIGGKNDVVKDTLDYLVSNFDNIYGGFSDAPKFPMPANLIFLMTYHETVKDRRSLPMVEKTLQGLAKGGIFDQIGYGFSRYSTDRMWLAPHFEKMLYDNAQLIAAYLKCFRLTENQTYKFVAVRCIDYVLRELKSKEGAFYSAEDADVDGEEGAFYLFSKQEIIAALGKENGETFCKRYGITADGNYEGSNIPNQINNSVVLCEPFQKELYEYRRQRYSLHRDDKILTVWNCLMISALCSAYAILDDKQYLKSALDAFAFLKNHLVEKDAVFTSWRAGRHNGNGVLDDCAYFISACIDLYSVTFDTGYIDLAQKIYQAAERDFADVKGGYFLSRASDRLILRPKEVYDGVIPCGNSVMADNLLFLSFYSNGIDRAKQFDYLSEQGLYGGQSYFASILLKREYFTKIVVSAKSPYDLDKRGLFGFNLVKIVAPSLEYPLKNDQTTYYICKGDRCLPPSNSFKNPISFKVINEL